MYEEFLDKYCKHWKISKEDALTHRIVQLFLEEKARIDKEEQVSSEKVRVQRDNV